MTSVKTAARPANTGIFSNRPTQAPAVKSAQSDLLTVNGQSFKLSPETVKRYLVSGGGMVTDQEVMMFIMICKDQGLNPFAKDAYLIKYGNQPAAVVTSIGAMQKRAADFPEFAGIESGIFVRTADGSIKRREGALYIPGEETIIGGWATCYRKDREIQPHYECTFEEYVGRKKDGEINTQWATKPAIMIRKCAIAGAIREAFPKQYASIYERDEIRRNEIEAQDVELSEPEGIPADEMLTIESPSEFELETQKTQTEEILAGARK